MTRWNLLGAMMGIVALPVSAGAAPLAPETPAMEAAQVDSGADSLLIAQGPARAAASSARAAAPAARAAAPAARAAAPAARAASAATQVTVTRPATGTRVTVTRPPAASTPRVSGSVNVRVNVAPPPPRYAPAPPAPSAPPPPRYSSPPPPPPGSAPPPPAHVVRPPQTTVYYGWRNPTVYVYPSMYSRVWGWWWWTPPTYNNYYYNDAPQRSNAQAPQEDKRDERQALHVGDTSFGVLGGVMQGAYQDGSIYSDPGFRFSVRHRVSPHVGVDVSGGFYGTTLYEEPDRSDRRSDVPLQLSGTLHLFPEMPVQLFALAGVTADMRDFQKVGYTEGGKDFYYDDGRFKDVRFGPHVGLGAELMIGEDISIHGDARWTTFTLVDGASVEQTVPGSFNASAGVSFFF